jgi:hypothetical protein
MHTLFWQDIACPYCGEVCSVQVDTSAGEQAYIEDCQVCCRPMELHLRTWDGNWSLEVRRDDD